MINVPASTIGVLDHSGGILRADKALSAFQVAVHCMHFLSNIALYLHQLIRNYFSNLLDIYGHL